MTTMTISKIEYKLLKEKANYYEKLRKMVEKDIFTPPPSKSTKQVLRAFSKTKRYNKAFLESLEKGLSRSSYFHS